MKRPTRARPGAEPKSRQLPLDWVQCNFLENLLRCVLDTRSVPRESGVHFQISSKVKDEAICLLFKIDRGDDSVIRDARGKPQIRPDYLVAHVSPAGLLFTIIELKGTEQRNLGHGVEQILALYELLRAEMSAHCPRWVRAHYQGILLCAAGAQIPKNLLAKTWPHLRIAPLAFHHKAELHRYVTRRLPDKLSDCVYRHEESSRERGGSFGALERILVQGPLNRRLTDSLHKERFRAGAARCGVYANFASAATKPNEYVALVADRDRGQIVLGVRGDTLHATVTGELDSLGLLPDGKRYIVREIDG